MLFIAYSILFSCFGKWDFRSEYHQCRIGQRDPTLVGPACGPGSWQYLGKIMVRLFSPRNIVVMFICYGLRCSLVALHDHGTCAC